MSDKTLPKDPSYTAFRELRERAGLTQRALADALGVHPSMVALWEAGQRPIPTYRLSAVAQAFGVTVSEAEASLVYRAPLPRGATVPPPAPALVEPPTHVDPAEPDLWTRLDRESRDAVERYFSWATVETARAQHAERFRAGMGRPRYTPSHVGLFMGVPAPVPGRPRRDSAA